MQKVIAEKRSTFNAKEQKLTRLTDVVGLLVLREDGLRCAAMRRGHRDLFDGFKPLLPRSDPLWRCARIHGQRDLMVREGENGNVYCALSKT